ncbi:MAG TPA: hypothetical protein DEF80_19115, partial [Pantoea sp.]|nr:hypothetical protein [Pantoea sp.]
CCMNPHDPKRIVSPPARQYWRAFAYVMQVHENHCIKRAGVAGLRARAVGARWSECGAISGPLARCLRQIWFEVEKRVRPVW